MPLTRRERHKPSPEPAGGNGSGGGGDIPIRAEDRTAVARALHALTEGDSRAFCDILWLGLGDAWVQMLHTLTHAQCVAVVDPESAEGIEIRDRGRTLSARLSDYR